MFLPPAWQLQQFWHYLMLLLKQGTEEDKPPAPLLALPPSAWLARGGQAGKARRRPRWPWHITACCAGNGPGTRSFPHLEKICSCWFDFLLKYVIREALPISLTGPAAWPPSEPSEIGFSQKLLLGPSLTTKKTVPIQHRPGQ